jgi:predicted chitinase
MDGGDINSCERQSAFLAQTAQESAEYNLMVEQGNACEAYPVSFPCPQLSTSCHF